MVERDADKTGSVDGSNVLQQNFKKLFDRTEALLTEDVIAWFALKV